MGAGQYTIRVKGTLDSTAIQAELNRLQRQAFTVGGGGRGKGTVYGAMGRDAKSATKNIKGFNGQVVQTERRLKGVSKGSVNGKTYRVIGDSAKQSSKAMKGFGQQTLDVTKKVIQFGAVTAVIRGVTSGMADMVQNVFELDASLTEFKKVSDLSAKGLEKYTEEAYKAGRETARTGTEMIDAATQFKKMGYTEEQSLQLATTATMFQNIADAEISAGDAALFINSQLKAFNFSADESQHVIGAVNEVANQFAVGTNDLQLALSKTASAMGGFGNSYEQTIGIITAGTEIMVGQPSKVARGWRTIGANIAKLAKETDTYSTASGKVNIEMRKQDGTMKNTYEFLTDLHEQWGNLNNEQKTAIALQLGGKNQMEVFLATMNNFDTALNATNTAMGEQNSAAKENAKYLESLAGHLANLKSAWEEFSFKMVSSDALKKGMDILADILHFLTTDVGQGIIKLALLTTGINLLAKALLGLKGLSVVKLFSGIGKGAKEAGDALNVMQKAQVGASGFLGKLGSSVSKLAGGFLGGGGLVAGVALASVALAKFVPIGKEAEKIQLHKNMEKTRTELENMQGRYKSLTKELETYREMEKEGTLNKYDEERLHTLENQTAQLKEQIELKKKLQASQSKEDYSLISEKDLTGKAHDVYAKAMSEGKSETQALAIVKQQTGVYDKLSASLDKVRNSALETAQAEKQYGRESEQYLKAYEKQGNSLEELQKIRKQAIKDFGDEKTAQKELGESYVALNKEIKGLKALQAIDWKTPTKNMSKLAKNADKLGLGFDSAGKKIESLDLGTFSRMMTEAGYDTEKTWKFIKQIGKENPEVKINVDGTEVAISDLEYVDGAIQAVNDKEAKVNVDDSEIKQAQEEWDNMTLKEREAIIKGNNKDAKKKYSEVKGYKNLEKTLTLDGENAQAKSAYSKISGLSDVYKTLHVRGEIEQSFYNAAQKLKSAAAKGSEHATGRRGANQPEEFSEVNERGWEFIRDAKTGQLRVAGGGKRTVTLLGKGDEVYTHAESLRMMRDDNDVIVPQFAKGKKATKAQKKKIKKLRSQFDTKLDILEYKRDRYHWSDAYFNKQYKKLYNKYKKKISKVKKGYGLGRERTQDYYLSRSGEKHDAAIDLLDARVEDIGYYYSLSKTLTKIKNLRKQRKISAEEAEEYRKQAYKANIEYNLKMFANDKKTLKQTRDAIKTAYKNNKISAQEYYDYLEELAQTQLDKERERIEKRKELEENRYDLARTYVQQQIDLIEKENEEQEEQNELLKLQADLASARNRKIRIFKEGEGFVYERDTEAIKEATDALKEYQGTADTTARTKPWRDILDMMDAMEVEASIKSLENKIGTTTEELFGKMGTSLVDWTNWVSQNLSTTIGLDSILEKLETLTTYDEAVKALGENLKVTDAMINKAIEKSTITSSIDTSTQGIVAHSSTISGTKVAAELRRAAEAKLGDMTGANTSVALKVGRAAARMADGIVTGISINNVNLPNVKDGEQFVTELENIALQASTARS